MNFSPRAYQETAVRQAIELLKKNGRTLIPAATGAGKTIMAGMVIDRLLEPKQRAIIVVHTKKLAHQPIARWREHFPHMGSFGVVQSPSNEVNRRIVSCTFQSLASINF